MVRVASKKKEPKSKKVVNNKKVSEKRRVNGRKNIRKIIKNKNVGIDTKIANQHELVRKTRVNAREKIVSVLCCASKIRNCLIYFIFIINESFFSAERKIRRKISARF